MIAITKIILFIGLNSRDYHYNLIGMNTFAKDIEKMLGLQISEAQDSAFRSYGREMLEWNKRHNLTAIRHVEDVFVRHFLDSLTCWPAMASHPHQKVIDVGSGAGLPGLALKIIKDSMQVTLLESVGKKTRFLDHMVQVLGLNNVKVINGRAEEIAHLKGERESYDWAIARAVAPLNVLAEYCLPFVQVGGYMLAQKGELSELELSEAASAIEMLGGTKAQLMDVQVPGLDEKRTLVLIEKVGSTDQKFPRRTGLPAKRPL